MPGKHSPAKLADRRRRARRRGFYVPIVSGSRAVIASARGGKESDTLSGDTIAFCSGLDVEDPLCLSDPWARYAASQPRECSGAVPSTSRGVTGSAAFNANAEDYVPLGHLCTGGADA